MSAAGLTSSNHVALPETNSPNNCTYLLSKGRNYCQKAKNFFHSIPALQPTHSNNTPLRIIDKPTNNNMDKTHQTTSANESDMPTTETAESLQDKVFGLPELCENILLQLNDSKITLRGIPLDDPIKQLFVLQRVSRTFKGTIEGSRKLRKLMWLVSVNATPREMQDSYFLRRLKICPLGKWRSTNLEYVPLTESRLAFVRDELLRGHGRN